ncbi:leucine-rich repeat serine/threonine-protein kinase 1-like isoform X2 [Saccostrea echinata]|uniref:leucine-rich repeat serine/threonine-protein kinase 1-like isoform X2 n=1 Tax=Saccostrea echinata TaxID=191078 RepID=UPI002A841B70|nr:leucine-rich repeat serine/threonine-protein kinase 1-like isoform X2 [Saccostrea echinata]
MEKDDQSDIIQKLKTAILDNDSVSLKEILRSSPEVSDLTVDGLPLIHYVCKHPGSSCDVIQAILQSSSVDVNQSSDEGTPLQLACKHGTDQVVPVLLDAGAWLESEEVPIYDNNSPFYLASAYGHYGVIEKLFLYQPKLVKDLRVRTCLLYAACLGGNQRIIRLWLTPEMDINHPPYYCRSGSFSMDKTPLYAACAGNHLEVTELLVGFGAELTQKIIEDFPEISGKLVKNCISQQQLEYTHEGYSEDLVHIANYSHKELGGFHEHWLSDYKNILVELNISNNNIRRLPAAIPWSLPSLKIFNASFNKITAFKVESPSAIQCSHLENVLLQENLLEELCYELFQLPELKYLNVAHNRMKYLVKSHQRYDDWKKLTADTEKPEWSCTKLRCLNASYNKLEMLPTEISSCTGLVELDASNNKLVAFPSPWECKLSTLNLSHNEIFRFAPSVELFWCATLKKLHLDFNLLEEMTESMVKLCCLQVLNLSNNKISVLHRPEVWDCKMLQILDLSGNRLGLPTGDSPIPSQKTKIHVLPKRLSRTSTSAENDSAKIVFPSFLAHCLNELNLSDNCLDCVPPSVCELVSLQTLDISRNPSIKVLPKELGQLSQCNSLNVHGTGIAGDEPASPVDCHIWTKKMIQSLNEKLRQSKGYYRIKLVVIGKKDKGKTAITNLLGCKANIEFHGTGLRRVETILSPKKKGSSILSKLPHHHKHRIRTERDHSKKVPVELCVWDLAGDECYKATQHCFFTPNSLYLVVWDLWSLAKDMDKIGKLLYSIEARNPNSKVIIAATFLDKNNSPNRVNEVTEIKEKLLEAFGSSSERCGGLCSQLEDYNIIPMSCTTGEGVAELRDALYNAAFTMKEGGKSGGRYLMGRSIPNSYIQVEREVYKELENRVRDEKPTFLVQNELYELIEKIPGCDIEIPQEVSEVVKFLVTSGAMLHFNEQLQGLNNFYYLDPTWLCDVLSQVLMDSALVRSMKGGKIPLSTVQDMYLNDSRFPNENVPQYIQLLEQFEIALKVESDKKLFIPSHLHPNPGMDLQFHGRDGKRVFRLYQLAFIPNGLWSRLLSRIMCRIELLANDWVLRSSVRMKPGKSFYRFNPKSSLTGGKGLKISNKDMIYWEDGMFLRHEKGHFMLESIQLTQKEGYITHGILITVQSVEEDYSIMGMIVDAVEDLLSDHYPGLMDYDMMGRPRIQRFAVCPICYNITSTVLPSHLDHFTVEHCARLLLSGDSAVCRRGSKVPLSQLVPELLMQELPKKFLLDPDKLQVDPSNKKAYLGSGVTGSVFKGKYGDVEVAVKYYHGAPTMSGKHSLDSSYYSGGNISSVERNKPVKTDEDDDNDEEEDYVNALQMHLDKDEVSSIKAFRAFMEMRQEADVTSKLDYPCIVSLIGISIRPDLLMCLELAPLGSLRRVLDKEIEGREPFNKYRDKDKVFWPVFNKETNFKLVHQIVRGLDYLHKHDIIYRDLKSDNILVTSLDPEAPENVKLSDYGISKFNTSGGTVGLVGTPGYQAPEIMDGLAYDEKVDLFSFSMVLYEILSGERPYCEYKNMAQISRAMKIEAKRPNLQDFNIDPRFPMMERLMQLCWNQDATKRPSARDILTTNYMMSADFLAQHKHFPRELEEVDHVTSITEHGDVKQQVWIWEGSGDDRCYHILDATMCVYQAYRKPLPGASVTCMEKIGKQIWIGTEDEQIEVFGQQGVGHPSSLKKIDNLGATPTCIEYVKEPDSSIKRVYILLGDGQLKLYHNMKKPEVIEGEEVNMRHQFNWHLKKTLRLSKRTASCMAYVEETEEMWCGCGSEIVIVSSRTEMIERRIEINKDCQALLENKLPDVAKLVHMDFRIWALLANSSEILEFDTEMGILTHILKCDQINPHRMVVSKYISGGTINVQARPISRRMSDSSCSGDNISSGEFDKWFDDDLAKQSGDDNGPPPPVPERSYSISSPRRQAFSPPLPPRRPTSCNRSKTLPTRTSPTSQSPPPQSPVASRSRHPLVNSVVGVGDSLWVGRSSGDILIINVKSTSQTQHGCVMAVMHSHCDKPHIAHEVEKLVTVGDLIFSVIKADSKYSEVTAWEAYDASKIQKLEKIWARPKSLVYTMNTDDVVEIGEI